MKNYTIILILLLGQVASTQTCFTDGLTLSTQSQIDVIADELATCKVIDGRVAFLGDVIDLSAFSNIEEVKGGLLLFIVPLLASMEGLENIRKIEGTFSVLGTMIHTIPTYTQLEVGGLAVSDNSQLKSLGNLQEIIQLNSGGSIKISNNDSLRSIIGFNHIEELKSLNIDSNSSLDTILGFQALKMLTGGFRMFDNFSLDVVNLCPSLTSVWSFEIGQNNGGSFDLEGFSNLERIEQGLDISANHGLINMPAFPKLTYVGKSLIISDNVRLTKIKGFNNLETIGSGIEMIRNNRISEFTCFDKLSYINPTKRINISGSPTGSCSFNGLHEIKTIHSLNLGWFSSLEGFDDLETIGDLSLENLSIWDMSAFSNLRIIREISTSDMSVVNNLEGFNGIDIDSLETIPHMVRNSNLSNCKSAWLCTYLESGKTISTLEDNAPGCNTIEEILESCKTLSAMDETLSEVHIYPSPAVDDLYINVPAELIVSRVSITDQMGRLVYDTDRLNGHIDVSSLVTGIYVVSLHTSDSVVNEKVFVE